MSSPLSLVAPTTIMSAASAPAMPPFLIVAILSLLLGLQTVSTDLYLPALPMTTQGFGASMAQAQLTLTALLLAFGLSQLVWGPLSDRSGRRPIVLGILLAYVLAAFVMGACLGTHLDGTVRPLAYGVWFWSVLTALIAWTLVQQHGHTAEH